MLKTAVILAMLLTLPALCSEAWARLARPLTARQAFALIPTEIFDNTREPLSEADRAQLADQGVTEHWSIAEDSCDTLRLASAEGLPDVSLQMFRSKKGAVAAFRTEDDNGECISELWYISAGGHAPFQRYRGSLDCPAQRLLSSSQPFAVCAFHYTRFFRPCQQI